MNPKKLIISQVREMLERNNVTDIKAVNFFLPVTAKKGEAKLENTKGQFTVLNDLEIDRKNILVKIFLSKLDKYCLFYKIKSEYYLIKIDFENEELFFFIQSDEGLIIEVNL